MKKTYQISNFIALVVTIFVNYLSSSGAINGTTVADISDRYNTLFTPAGYAFSIWGLIYLSLLAFVIFEFTKSSNHDKSFLMQTGWWFVISCIANCIWILSWISGYLGLSIIIMAILLFSLLKIVANTNMERWDAPLKTIAFRWWPFCLYSGWITVATIANISAYLTKVGWGGWGISHVGWAVIMIIAAGIVNLLMIWKRCMREFAVVGIWALIAIAVANWNQQSVIVWAAATVSAILFINISIHAYINRDTSPYVKLMNSQA